MESGNGRNATCNGTSVYATGRATMPRASPLTLAGRSQHGHRQPTATALAKAVVAAAPMAAPPHAQVDIEAAAPGRRCRRCAVAAPPLPAAVASVRI